MYIKVNGFLKPVEREQNNNLMSLVTYAYDNQSIVLIISIDKRGRRHFIFNHSMSIGCVPKCLCLSFLHDFVELLIV
jgi:hypothetical protein